MMMCGHAANAIQSETGEPVCVICWGLTELAKIVDENPPALIGRTAKCGCGATEPSSTTLAFFDYKGPGSKSATDRCGVCPYTLVAHGEVNELTGRPGITDHAFVPHGPYEFDAYYCGHSGWD